MELLQGARQVLPGPGRVAFGHQKVPETPQPGSLGSTQLDNFKESLS